MNKILLWGGAGAAALAWLLWPKSASAQPNKPPGPGPSPWKPGHWPTTPFPAVVNANAGAGAGNMVVRSGPSTTSPRTNKAGQNQNGSTVTVTQTGLSSSDGSAGEWWAITSPTGSGFVRAVDPTGYVNFTIPSTVTSGVGAPLLNRSSYYATHRGGVEYAYPNAPIQLTVEDPFDYGWGYAGGYSGPAAWRARRDWEAAVRMGAHPAHVEALRRRYASMMQGGGG